MVEHKDVVKEKHVHIADEPSLVAELIVRNQYIAEHRDSMRELNQSTQLTLGLRQHGSDDEVTYDQYEYFFTRITDGLERGWCADHVRDSYDEDI